MFFHIFFEKKTKKARLKYFYVFSYFLFCFFSKIFLDKKNVDPPPQQSVNDAHLSGSSVLTVTLEPLHSGLAELSPRR